MLHIRTALQRGFASCTLAAAALFVAAGAAASGPTYAQTDLGTFGGSDSISVDVNDTGRVVGWAMTSTGFQHAYSWTQASGLVDIGVLGQMPERQTSQAAAVNNAGLVVGWSYYGIGSFAHAFSWTQAGGLVDLGTLPGGYQSAATDVNDTGQVVGWSDDAGGVPHAVLWTTAGAVVDIGGRWSRAAAINDSGQVVCNTQLAFETQAFSWTPQGGRVDIGLGGVSSAAVALSDSGQVVGWARTPTGQRHAFSWTQAGGTLDLGALVAPGSWSDATAVNAAGQVVGRYVTEAGMNHAFSWTPASGMIDLGTLGYQSSDAYAVNDSGTVVGTSGQAFVWTSATGMVALTGSGGSFSSAVAVNGSGQIAGGAQVRPGPSYAWHAMLWSPARDTTPPVITVADVVADATAPAGATVGFTATAADEDPAQPNVTCIPASGSWFAIGDTVVTCTATDAAGNATQARFTVHVRGAAEQLASLGAVLPGVGPGRSLSDKVALAQVLLSQGKTEAIGQTLDAFVLEVKAQSSKTIPNELADMLITDASRIQAVIGFTGR
jgi:probable HAF family extracellular repeat protein